MKLLIDAGNSHIKWAVLEGRRLGPLQAGATEPEFSLPPALFEGEAPEAVIVSNVAGRGIATAIRDEARRRFEVEPQFVTATEEAFGVRNAYARPAQLGADRWAAMIGAFLEYGGPVCIVDAGTAFTVDVVAVDGLHLGGVIVPGIELMIGSLRGRTSDIAALEAALPAAGSRMLASNTADALRNGALHALVGLVERVIAEVEARIGAELPVVISGGDGERVRDALDRSATYNPALVLRGLAEFAGG